MRVAGVSVPEAVREIVTRNRSIYDCMKMDVINYTALAVRIRPEVERILGGPVNLNTVVVAIKRHADGLGGAEPAEPVLKDARLALTGGIVDIRLSAEESGGMDPGAVLDRFSKVTNDYEFFRVSDTFRFLAEDMDGVRRIFEGIAERDGLFSTGLAKIRISIPPGRSRSDVVSYVAEVLHANGVELANAFFGPDGIIVVLDEGDASRAYEILRSDITRA